METALIVYTQGTEVPYVMDLYLNETISLQYSFSDIKELKANASYSRSFRIPATDNNSQIFGFIENNTYQFSSFNPKRKLQAIITVDTLPIMEGNIQWKASYTQAGTISEYEIVFFGNVIDFFKNIGDADFKNYIAEELQNDYPFIVDFNNISDIINNDYGDGNIQVTLTDRGNNWVGNSNTEDSRSIYANPIYNPFNPSEFQEQIDQIIKVGELTLMIKAKYIFEKIIQLSGFQIDYTGSTTLIDQLNLLHVVWTGEANLIQQVGNPEAAKFKLENNIDGITFTGASFTPITMASGITLYYYPIPNLNEVIDPNNYVVNNVFTAPFNGRYTIKSSINIEQDSDGLGGFQLSFLIQDLNGDYRLSTVQTTGTFFANWTSGTTFPQRQNVNCGIGAAFETSVYLNAGETVQPILWDTNPNPVSSGVTLTFRDASLETGYPFSLNSSFFCDYVSKPMMGNEVDYSANAPVMKCNEFMSALFKMFNLVVVPNQFNSKLLTFIPIQEYLELGDNKDWSNKLDISKDIVLTPTTDYQAQVNTWTYKKSDDYLNNLYNTQGNRVYGRLQLLDPENDFATEEMKIEVEFGSTPLALIPNTNFPIPKFVNEKNEYVNPLPRILYYTGNNMNVNVWDEINGQVVTNYSIYLFSHYRQITPNVPTEDCNFGQETPLHNVNGIPFPTLYARYWNDYIANIYAPDARIMEAYFALEFADIYNFKYNDKIFIKDSYWRILEIKDYVVGMQESVKVKLMKMVSVTPDCFLTPVAIDTNGEVIFHDSEDNPQPATTECCKAYGYTWDGMNCFGFIRDSDGKKPMSKDQITLTKDITINTNKLLQVPNNSIDYNNMHSIVGGMNNYLGANNDGSLVNGNKNFIASDLGAVNVQGSNASVINKGLTIGGNGSYTGQVQSGIVHLFGNGDFTNNTTYIDLKIEGVDNYNIPTNTIWILKILLSGMQNTGADGTITGEYNLHIINRSTTVLFINATTIDETFDNFTGYLVWDVVISGETFYPRIKLVGSATYPENNIKFTALTTFTQYHYE